ncbi:stage III sporulation protein SpoIIIAB [Neobacillus mesonae]|nr:stage III sporulation protein SpoIIIAB [Neobacillus mesonae]
MLKLIGSVLILLSGLLAGFYQANLFASRPKQIRELTLMLQRLLTEINYSYRPLAEALDKIGQQASEPLGRLFISAADCMSSSQGLSAQESFQYAINKNWSRTAMKTPEKEAIRQLSYSLGTSDREEQNKHITLAIQQLTHEEAAARSDQMKYEKMSRSLGLLVGALIVILIL